MTEQEQAAAIQRSRAAWRDLGRRLATVTPSTLGRALLTVGVLGVLAGAVVGTWPAVVPFLIGGTIAYGVLPIVNSLDRFMPRWIAALASVLAVLAVVVGLFAIVLPPLALSVVRIASELPSAEVIDQRIADIETWLGSQPEGGSVLAPVLVGLTAALRDTLQGASGGLGDAAIAAARGLAGALGAVLSLVVLPTWILTVLAGHRGGIQALDRRLAPWLRADAWAIVRILDRTGSAYIRGYLVVGLAVGALTWGGLRLVEAVGGPVYSQPLALAVFAGITQLVPEIGPVVGFLPALLLLPIAPDRAAIYVVVYVAARFIGSGMIGGRVIHGRLGVHPAIMVPALVALSQLGLIWLFIAAPVVSIVANTIRYVHGRLSEPPRPAGLLPGDRVPIPARTPASVRSTPAARVPAAYRTVTPTR